MISQDVTKLLRRVIEIFVGLWTTLIFQGCVAGSALLFLRYVFEPYLIGHFSDVMRVDVPEWLYFAVGVGAVMFANKLSGKPLLRDKNREQFEAVAYIANNLPKLEQTQFYRAIAKKMVDDFKLSDEGRIDLETKAKNVLKEEKS